MGYPNLEEKKDNEKVNNPGIGSWWVGASRQLSQHSPQEECIKQPVKVDMKIPDYELYANEVRNSNDLHRKKILEIQDQRELYYREWQKNEKLLLNENNNVYGISKAQQQTTNDDKDEKILFLQSKLESVLAKQKETYNQIEQKMQDQTKNYIVKFNQMAERLANMESYATAQTNLVKEYKANSTSLNNSLIEMKETIRDYETRLNRPNVNSDLKELHECGENENTHDFSDEENEFDVMINNLHKNN